MRLHYLRYFVVLAEELHFSRAAQRLAITQPPLSGAIKALEAELGTPLLLRDSKRVELTPAGAAFRIEAEHILERIERAAAIARTVGVGLRGQLDVGVTGSLLYRDVPRIVHRFSQRMPDVDVRLVELASARQVDDLLRGQLHVGFLNASTVPPQLACQPLADDVFVCCLPAGHSLAGRPRLRLAQLAEEPFVMFAREVAPANYDNVVAIFSREGIHPRMVHAARQWLTVIAMVAHGLGVSLVPRSLERSGIDGVSFVPLAGQPAGSRALMVWNPAQATKATESFLACARADLGAPPA